MKSNNSLDRVMQDSSRQPVMRRWTTVFLLALAGCAGETSEYDAAVQGTVTVDDQLAPGGTVVFSPEDGGPDAVGSIGADGSYSLRIGRGDPGDPDNSGIPSGNYMATVSIVGPSGDGAPVAAGGPPAAGPRLMADKYADKKTSDLKYAVNEGVNIIVLNLDGPWANPPIEEPKEDGGKGDESDAESTAEDAAKEVAGETEAVESTSAESEPAAGTAGASESASNAPPSNEEPATTSQQTPAEEQPQ